MSVCCVTTSPPKLSGLKDFLLSSRADKLAVVPGKLWWPKAWWVCRDPAESVTGSAGRLAVGWRARLSTTGPLGPSGRLGLQNGGRAPRAGRGQTQGPGAFQPSACSALCPKQVLLNPDASGKWEKRLPLFMGRADNCGYFIIYWVDQKFIWVFL